MDGVKKYQTETNRFRAHLTDFLPSFGRALLVSAIDFRDNRWFADHFLLTGGGAKGASIESSYDPLVLPTEFLPSPVDELQHGIDVAEAILTQRLFAHEKILLRQLVPLRNFISPTPLTEKQVAQLYLHGEFTRAFSEIRDNTRCTALKEFLTDLLAVDPYRVSGEKQPDLLQLPSLNFAYSMDEPEYSESDLKVHE
jgi:hypothetical protein